MSLMSKLLMSALITSVALSANTTIPDTKTLLKYVKRSVVKNPQVTVKAINIIETQTHKDLEGWTILLTNMDLEYHKKEIHAPEIMFVKDGLVTGSLVNLKTGRDYRKEIKPTVKPELYNKEHLLFGDANATHKMVVFSDPQCPFCQEVVPEIFKAAKAHPELLAVYYYHLPLVRLHPVSDVLTRVMHIAQKEGRLDVVEKMYQLKINPRTTKVEKILSAVKKQTGFSVTPEQVESKEVKEALSADEKSAGEMMVQGTPTIYLDGKWDKMRDGYQKFIETKK